MFHNVNILLTAQLRLTVANVDSNDVQAIHLHGEYVRFRRTDHYSTEQLSPWPPQKKILCKQEKKALNSFPLIYWKLIELWNSDQTKQKDIKLKIVCFKTRFFISNSLYNYREKVLNNSW